MDLTDDELSEVDDLIFNEIMYGDDEVVYMTTESGRRTHELLASAREKIGHEAKRRGLRWGI